MKILFIASVLLVLATLHQPFATTHAQGTAFTYQGRLNDGVKPAAGTYDLRFAIYNTAAGGTAYGMLTNGATALTNGLFTVALDFGSVFDGTSYWLEISVRTNGTGAFTTLSQRQPVMPTPYAVYAGAASNLVGSVTAAQLPASVVTNGPSGANLAGTFTGDGGNLTNLNASALNGLNSTNFWQLGGNTVQSNVDFIGSVNKAPLDLKVNGYRALRLEPTALGAPNIIGGSRFNEAQHSALYGDPYSATVAGGGDYRVPNIVSAPFATVGGGAQNTASGFGSVVAGGGADGSNWGGNTAGGPASVVAGGFRNQVTGSYSTVGGGANNSVSGLFSTIPGGDNNEVAGDYSLAAGYRAKAITHGTFVWGDLQDADFASTANNQFLIQATGGVGIGTNHPHAALQVVGTVLATGFEGTFHGTYGGDFSGNGAGVTNVDAATLGGVPASGYWQLGGNNVGAGQFIGSTNKQPLELRANNLVGWRLLYGMSLAATIPGVSNVVNVVGGSADNLVGSGVIGAVIAGGGGNDGILGNSIYSDFSVIGGGAGNLISSGASGCIIGGGIGNTIHPDAGNDVIIGGGTANQIFSGAYGSIIGCGYSNAIDTNSSYSVLAGGCSNEIQRNSPLSTISGGFNNFIHTNSIASVIGGGNFNIIFPSSTNCIIGGGLSNQVLTNSSFATIPGGLYNQATSHAFAAGSGAWAIHDGSFVWADATNDLVSAHFQSTSTNQFLIRARGGVGINTNNPGGAALNVNGAIVASGTVTANGVLLTSDRNAKENFTAVDPRTMLAKVAALPITEWNYKNNDAGIHHVGPMAQDFQAAFQLSADDRHISVVDEGGVALAAIQGLNQKVEQKEAEITQLKARLEKLEQVISTLTGGAK